MIVSSGNRGDTIRSDCYAEIRKTGGKLNQIILKSRVETLYGTSIVDLCHHILDYYHIKGVSAYLEDYGALPFVISARVEAAVRKLFPDAGPFLPDPVHPLDAPHAPVSFRRTRLYVPGNNPKMMINAGIYGSDAVILDLEDSVIPGKKDEALILVRNALRYVNFYGAERMVRINALPAGINDIGCILPFGVQTILIPKCQSPSEILDLEQCIEKTGITESVSLIPVIESALGVEKAFDIACASKKVVALVIGLEDYTADIGAQRTEHGSESWYARSRVVNAARAAGIQPLDSVCSVVDDSALLKEVSKNSRAMGFEGMGCIHPGQIQTVNTQFSPSFQEIEKAQKIVAAFEKARDEGSGVVAVDGKMVDAPVVKRALRIIEYSCKSGWLTQNKKAHGENEMD